MSDGLTHNQTWPIEEVSERCELRLCSKSSRPSIDLSYYGTMTGLECQEESTAVPGFP